MNDKTILISDCVEQVESAGNPLAMRFEPDWTPTEEAVRLIQQQATQGYMDVTTARNIAATSFGRYQIMADNLYRATPFSGTLCQFIQDQNGEQLSAFEFFLEKIGFENIPFDRLSQTELEQFALHYNGNKAYAVSLQKAYQALAS